MTDPLTPRRTLATIDLQGWAQRRLAVVRVFAVALAMILVGYMFMGRGFAHLGLGPLYVGDWVLLVGLAAAGIAVVRERVRFHLTITTALLIAFMALGAIRTLPYISTYGMDALRDGVLWGYAAFALLVLLLFCERGWIWLAARAYAWLVPLFAIWLPIAWLIFNASQVGVDSTRPGANTPIVFFKAGDMAVHAAGAIALVVLAPSVGSFFRGVLARFAVSVPLTWTVYVAGSASRGAILAAGAALAVSAVRVPRLARWAPVLAAALVVVVGLSLPGLIPSWSSGPPPVPSAAPLASAQSPSATSAVTPGSVATPSPASPSGPPPVSGRPVSAAQWLENIVSIVGSGMDRNLDGTKGFRLAWWKAIVQYTVFGPYFWTGKGFGINLADADGFQPTADHSLRAPHNSHMSVLARMGVPGAVLWMMFQVSFAIGLLRGILAVRRDDVLLAVVGSWVLVMWAAMMVVTSFDPYLEGPQGGIWYWVVVGIGLGVTSLARVRTTP